MRRIIVQEPGGPDALTLVDEPVPTPGPADVLVATAASGVNFIDVYIRSGLYPSAPPIAMGSEGAGVVEAVGAEVSDFAPGDRVAFAMVTGTYAEYVTVPASRLVRVPDAVDLDTAAAVLLQGMTAHYLTCSTFPLVPGQTCLVHAAAGGTGGLIVQMAKARGVRVLATTSTAEKARAVRALGADEVIRYTEQDFAAEVRRLTDGAGVDVVYDSVGRATFEKSLRALRPRGLLVLFGQSSGSVPPFDPAILNASGSLFLTRPTLAHYVATADELRWRASDLFEMVASRSLRVRVSGVYPLEGAARAHRDLEARQSLGKFLLKVR